MSEKKNHIVLTIKEKKIYSTALFCLLGMFLWVGRDFFRGYFCRIWKDFGGTGKKIGANSCNLWRKNNLANPNNLVKIVVQDKSYRIK